MKLPPLPAWGVAALLAASPVTAQVILECRPANSNGTSATVQTDVLYGRSYAIEASADLTSWRKVGEDLVGTGLPLDHVLPDLAPDERFFRLNWVVPHEILSWDLYPSHPAWGVATIAMDGSFDLLELVDIADGLPRRDAGLFFRDGINGNRFLMRTTPQGYPLEIFVNDVGLVRFSAHNPQTLQVTVQFYDANETAQAPPETVSAPLAFFGGPAAIPPPGETASEPPPTVRKRLLNAAETGLNIIGDVAFVAESPAKATAAHALVSASVMKFAKEEGYDFGLAVDGALWGAEAAQCGIFLVEAATATLVTIKTAGAATVPLWFIYSVKIGAGLSNCHGAIEPVVEFAQTVANSDPYEAGVAFIMEAEECTQRIGNPYYNTAEELGYRWHRNEEFFTDVGKICAFYSQADAKAHETDPARRDALLDWVSGGRTWVGGHLGYHREILRQQIHPIELNIDSVRAAIPDAAPESLPYLQASLSFMEGNLEVMNGIVATLESWMSSVGWTE